ncbi:N-formylglutamate amidohydrolase [Weeksellaceae bacterium KMM 9713]|uniref:N-formylglutamate amidohydrolase n=1 Tax=Profundicola chukchiensis TaxID=2961959 RepID=A0A9X4MUF6_9FLAO|nr:N-formylglutamate amidohydrolase [Profundicola chukchiensis]MDG4945111.1 N-formylglutamate amidohydrolase [Profundicola chukchiensis]
MKKIILHIPHASAHFPSKENYVVTEKALQEEVLKLTDWYTDELFEFEKGIPIKANFSRIYCDPERFVDDAKEVMAKRGMGVLYERTEEGLILRNVTPSMRKEILEECYHPHHERLEKAVSEQFEKYQKALIVDCHSFPNTPLPRALDKSPNRPDFNIGTDQFHTPRYLVSAAKEFFQEKGYNVGVDWPFTGSLVPIKYYQRSFDVNSIMLEVNRSLYLEDDSNQKSSSFNKTKQVIQEFLEVMHHTYYKNDDFTEESIEFRKFQNDNLAEYSNYFRSKSDEELVECFNSEVRNSGWGNLRSIFLCALRMELKNRNFGGVSVIHEKGGLALNRKVQLVEGNLAFIDADLN